MISLYLFIGFIFAVVYAFSTYGTRYVNAPLKPGYKELLHDVVMEPVNRLERRFHVRAEIVMAVYGLFGWPVIVYRLIKNFEKDRQEVLRRTGYDLKKLDGVTVDFPWAKRA